MKKLLFVLLMLCTIVPLFGQITATIKGNALLKKTIQFHDPKGNWSKFHQKLYFHAKEPKDTAIYEQVFLDNRYSFFGHVGKIEGKHIEKGIIDTTYFSSIDADTSMTAEVRKKFRLSKRAIRSARNSYVFLYGLPMKLTDKGVDITDEVKIDTFNHEKYYVLKADFDKTVGTDTWFFYINQTTFAIEGYRFFHNRKPNDGEFVVCKDLLYIQGMKIPKVRYWYSNENGEYIATDIVEKTEDWQYKPQNGTNLTKK